jgi:hypothetical protein
MSLFAAMLTDLKMFQHLLVHDNLWKLHVQTIASLDEHQQDEVECQKPSKNIEEVLKLQESFDKPGSFADSNSTRDCRKIALSNLRRMCQCDADIVVEKVMEFSLIDIMSEHCLYFFESKQQRISSQNGRLKILKVLVSCTAGMKYDLRVADDFLLFMWEHLFQLLNDITLADLTFDSHSISNIYLECMFIISVLTNLYENNHNIAAMLSRISSSAVSSNSNLI